MEKAAKKKRVKVVVAHPDKTIERIFENPKGGEVSEWVYGLSQTLPPFEGNVRKKRWINIGLRGGMRTTDANSGHLFGLAIYLIHEN